MCGIAGGFSELSLKMATEEIVRAVSQSIVHRGPDADGFFTHESKKTVCCFAHRRLSIIDLSAEANQPFESQCGRYTLVFNGEIFNYLELKSELKNDYPFKSHSDTEVLLAAFIHWGFDCFEKFNGMFAGAIYDKCDRKLYLFRDRFGIKPLYYFADQKQIFFCSETRALAERLSLDVNPAYLARGVHLGVYEMGDGQSQYKDLHELMPGNVLEVCFENTIVTESSNYYSLDTRVNQLVLELKDLSYQSLCEQLLDLLKSSVQLRLRSDVPVGVTLSGGLDSSFIMALVNELHPGNNMAFSYGDLSEQATEAHLVAETCKKLNSKVTYCYWRDFDVNENYWRALYYQDAPFGSLSIVAQNILYQSIQQNHFKVTLGGQGADEAFMGYRKFLLFNLKALLRQRKYGGFLFELLNCLPTFVLEFSRGSFTKDAFYKYISPFKTQPLKLNVPKGRYLPDIQLASDLQKRQRFDILHYSLPTLLRYEDRNSMSSSVESRLPFMDYRLIEFACALSTTHHVNRGFGKAMLRDVAAKRVTKRIRRARYKRGFDVTEDVLKMKGLYKQMLDYIKRGEAHFEKYDIHLSLENYSLSGAQKNPVIVRELIALCWLRYINERSSLPIKI